MEYVIVKLGGSVITNKLKPYSLRRITVKRLAKEIKTSKKNVILIHGGGSFTHPTAVKYGGARGYNNLVGVTKVALNAMLLNSHIVSIFIDEGIATVQFRPMNVFYSKSSVLKDNFLRLLEPILKQGIVPVLHGDIIFDSAWKTTIFSGERSGNEVLKYLLDNNHQVHSIIQVGVTDGVYDANKKTISKIDTKSYKRIDPNIFTLRGADVTGGIKHKIEQSLKSAGYGIKTLIINGNRKDELLLALTDKAIKGTIITK